MAARNPKMKHPIEKSPRPRQKSADDVKAFQQAAGGWEHVDTDQLIETIRESRRRSRRPPVEL